MHTPSGNQEMTVISEPGLYSLILRSRKPEPTHPRSGSPTPWNPRKPTSSSVT